MRRSIAAALCAALAASAARADVDVTSAPPIKVKSTLLPVGEVETYRLQAVAGAKLSFALAATGKTRLAFTPALTDPNAAAVVLPQGALKTTKTGVALTGLVLSTTGEYRLDVSADKTGDYSLTLSTAPQTKWSGTLTTIFPGGAQRFTFSAPIGSTVTITAKPVVKGQGSPSVDDVSSGAFRQVFFQQGKPLPTRAVFTAAAASGATGDFAADVSNRGTATGDAIVTATVKPPKSKTSKLDLRGTSLGRPDGGETLVSRVVGAGGGGVDVSDPASDLVGASVVVPDGALTGPLTISIASATTPSLPDHGMQAAGPAVDFGPSGTTFAKTATVTLPFDFSLLPQNVDPSQILVFIREKDGSSTTVAPSSVDVAHGTISLPVGGFSTCVPISPAGIVRLGVTSSGGLRPGGDAYWVLGVHFDMSQDATNDSRNRDYEMQVGQASFFGDGSVQMSSEQRQIQVAQPYDGMGGIAGTVQTIVQQQNDTQPYVYDADGLSLDVGDGASKPPAKVRVSRGGTLMAGRDRTANDTKVELTILLRQDKTPPTTSSFAGTWNMGGIEIDANGSGGGPVNMKSQHISGTITFDGKGGFRIAGGQRQSQFQPGGTTWSNALKTLSISGTYTIRDDGTAVLVIPPQKPGDTGNTLRLMSGPNEDALLATDDVAQQGDFLVLMFTRQGSGLSPASLVGAYSGEGIESDTSTYAVGEGPTTLGDLVQRDEDVSVTFAGTTSAQFTTADHAVERDNTADGGVAVSNDPGAFAGTISLSSSGVLKVKQAQGSVVGAMTPDATFGFVLTDLATSDGTHYFAVVFENP